MGEKSCWISVNDRLPEDGELVLVIANGLLRNNRCYGAYELAMYYSEGVEDSTGEWHEAEWEMWDYRRDDVEELEVLYWAPLPESPEGVE